MLRRRRNVAWRKWIGLAARYRARDARARRHRLRTSFSRRNAPMTHGAFARGKMMPSAELAHGAPGVGAGRGGLN